MAASSSARSLASAFKRLKLTPPTPAAQRQTRHVHHSLPRSAPAKASSASVEEELAQLRLPKAVQATYLAPLKRPIPEGAQKSASLQLRSYSVRNLEVFADFALRAAYYLGLPATGPRPLPRKIQRWTLPRSNFVHKKSQETFERITMQRLVEIQDGHPEVVAIWLAFLRKHQYYGVGMKAHVYEHTGVDTARQLDEAADRLADVEADVEEGQGMPSHIAPGFSKAFRSDALFTKTFKDSWGGAASSGAQPVPEQNATGLHIEKIIPGLPLPKSKKSKAAGSGADGGDQ